MGIPLLLDNDDPDLEATLSWRQPIRRLAKEVLHPQTVARARLFRRWTSKYTRTVSNPELVRSARDYLLPHVREDLGDGAPHLSGDPKIAFVGSPAKHKGLEILRYAVAQARKNCSMTLTITAPPPIDSQPWENWVGITSFRDGIGLVRNSDIVALPSRNVSYAHGQLPVKLVDAMFLGRAIVVSDIEPMPWAIARGSAGLVVPPDSKCALVEALLRLRDPALRTKLGYMARERAQTIFGVEDNAITFEKACRHAISCP